MDSFSRIVFCTVLLFQHTWSLENCSNSLGISARTKIIPDESITSSSYLSSDRAPSYARLDGPRAWCSAPGDNSSYIQILLKEETLITAIETQGSRYDSIWSRTYDVWYLKRGKWILHRKGLPGNKNARQVHRNTLSSPIRTRSIRIYPKDPLAVYTAPKFPCLRLELYGCTAPASCPDPGIPYQGKRIDQNFRHGHTVRFTCPRDYVMEGAAAIKCTDGRWNNTKPSCKAPCVEPTDPKHGLKLDRDFSHGRSVRFYCSSGYQRVGAASIKCNDGKWDGWVPLCKGVCGRPRTSSRVQLHGSRYLHGDEVTFSCHRNYDLFGKAKLQCMDRTWDSPAPECKARCTLLDPPEHGFYMKGFRNKDDMIKHGDKIRYGCNATYTLEGNSAQECNDGRWNNPRPSCKASCLAPAGMEHGVHIGNDYGHGETIRFQCDRGYTLEGKDRVSCNDGKWHSDKPNCKAFMDSSILNTNISYFSYLGKFLEPVVGYNSRWLLCWRATLHGWDVRKQFHRRCDGKRDTVTIIKKDKYVFGGYTDIPWESSGYYNGFTLKAFIFSISNKEELAPFVCKVKRPDLAIRRSSWFGPAFGFDIIIANNANNNSYSFTGLGIAYPAPAAAQNPDTILAGTEYISPDEVEVLYLGPTQ